MGVTRLKFDLNALGRLAEDQAPPGRQLRAHRQAVSYLMGETNCLGFGLVLWGQGKLVSESGEFTPLYQGTYSKFHEVDNLTTEIEKIVASRELKDLKFCLFTDILVFKGDN